MKKLLLFTVLLVVFSFSYSQSTFYFNTNQAWNNTGYSYSAGTEIFIYAFGSHADNPNTNNWIETPAGKSYIPTSGHPLNGAPENGLIGKIGANGTPFYIGAGGLMTLSNTQSGDLYLEVNDGNIANNVGYIFVHIFNNLSLTTYFNTNQAWNNTGYSYSAGTEIFIYAFGSHADNPNTNNWIETPAGKSYIPTSGHPLNGAPENGLIGKIGTSGTPFYIGAGGLMTLSNTQSGDLYLEVNDGNINNNVGQIFVHIFEGNALSIKEKINSNGIVSIFPNPTKDFLNINCLNPSKDRLTVKMINSSGAIIIYEHFNSDHNVINLSNFSSGVYYISILKSTGELIETKKVIVE